MKPQFKIALYLQDLILREDHDRWRDTRAWTITVRPVILGNESPWDKQENPDFTKIGNPSDSRDFNGLYLNGLEIIARGEERAEGRVVWHYEYRYDVYKVDRSNAFRLAKTIKTLDARMAKIAERDGYAKTYLDFVRRMAQALKVDQFVQATNDRGDFYADTSHRFLTTGEGINTLDHAIWRWQQEPIEKAAADARAREQAEPREA